MSLKAERVEALRTDPTVLSIRHTAEAVEASALTSWMQSHLDGELEALTWADDKDARAVRRMAEGAAGDDGYRVQLVDLAALHGGLYRKAVDAIYAIEVRSLGRFEALARLVLDERLLATHARGREGERSS
jgi:hypothetical protein